MNKTYSLLDLQKLWKVPKSKLLEVTTNPNFPKPQTNSKGQHRWSTAEIDEWLEQQRLLAAKE
jgi:predicted DNA-binding transcriptional regulator AlpA